MNVIDVNDLNPIFDESHYRVEVHENLTFVRVYYRLMNLWATHIINISLCMCREPALFKYLHSIKTRESMTLYATLSHQETQN